MIGYLDYNYIIEKYAFVEYNIFTWKKTASKKSESERKERYLSYYMCTKIIYTKIENFRTIY